MDTQGKGSGKVWMPLSFSLVLVVGMILGFNLRDTLRSKRDISTVIQRNDRLDEIIDLVTDKYVDTINNNVLYQDALSGILKSLDPHTVYIPADDLEAVNDDLEGGFSGIGIEFAIVRDTIEITAVTDKGPAGNAGIETGDELIKVGDSLVAGVNITNERITHLLRGKQQSVVNISVKRPGGQLQRYAITRGIIPTYSVEASIMLDSITGFIKINRFSATTANEFKSALTKLTDQGIKQLVVDLRDNPGGYLDAATAIADQFLEDGKLMVYTAGLHSPKTEYKSKEKGLFEHGKLAILVDEGSASASEILAGAIQDWDRGIILGRRTYGKGLVQEQYELPDGAALRLTVAKYYTPSGRCIQRSFAEGKEAYRADFEKRFEDGELTGNDSAHTDTSTPFFTANHRPVFAGGGIKPDIYVPYDTGKISVAFRSMVYSTELKTAVWDYFVQNKAQLKFGSISEFARSFNQQDKVTGSYLAMLDNSERRKIATLLAKPANKDYLNQQIKARLARFLFHDNGYYSISLKDDDVVVKALAAFRGEQYSKLILGK